MAKVKKSDVEKMARLSKLNLTDAEKEKFASQFSDILGYVEELSEIAPTLLRRKVGVPTESSERLDFRHATAGDNKGVELIDNICGKSNVFRKDKVVNKTDRKEILKNAPDQEDGFIKVKAVLK